MGPENFAQLHQTSQKWWHFAVTHRRMGTQTHGPQTALVPWEICFCIFFWGRRETMNPTKFLPLYFVRDNMLSVLFKLLRKVWWREAVNSSEVAVLLLTLYYFNVVKIYQQWWFEESSQRLENVNLTHLVLASGKPVLHKCLMEILTLVQQFG